MRPKITLLCLAIILVILAAPARASEIHGYAHAKDGDSLMVDRIEIRLFGIDAPEYKQTCRNNRDGHEWPCGKSARNHLISLIHGDIVDCDKVTTDKYNRVVARCHTDTTDLNRKMVMDGWAFAFTYYSMDFKDDESQARADKRGMWDSTVQPPWDWRHEHPRRQQ